MRGSTRAVLRRPSDTSYSTWPLVRAPCSYKIWRKWPKCQNFHLLRQIAWHPGGQLQKSANTIVGHGLKTIPTKFRSNLLTFGATSSEKTDERRVTPQQSRGRFATLEWGLRPTWGVASRPLFSARTALKKGTTSLRSVVNKLILTSQTTFVSTTLPKNQSLVMSGLRSSRNLSVHSLGSGLHPDGPGHPENVENNPPKHPKQLLLQQLFQKINPWGCPGSGPPGTCWRLPR